MTKNNAIRCLLTSLLLLLALMFFSCEKEAEPERPLLLDNPESTVWAETRFDLSEEYMFDMSGGGLRCRDGRIYANVYKLISPEEGSDAEKTVVSWNTDGSDFREETGTGGVQPCFDSAVVLYAETLSGGETATFESVADPSGAAGLFCVRDKDGKRLFAADLPGCFGQEWGEDSAVAGAELQLWDAAAVGSGTERRYLAATSEGIACFDENGAQLGQLTGCNARAIVNVGEQVLFFGKGSSGGISLYPFDPATGERGEKIVLPAEIASASGAVAGTLHGGWSDGWPAYWQNGEGLFGLRFTGNGAEELACEAVLLVDWNESDLFGGYEDLYAVDEETICAIDMEFDASKLNAFACFLSVLRRLPKEEVEGRIRLEVAVLSPYDADLLREKAVSFNRAHPGVHVTVTDLLTAADGDYDAARLHLDAEIAAGNVPDVLCVSRHASNVTTADDYVRAGVFRDLIPLADSSDSFDYGDLVGSMKAPFTDGDGRQFLLPLTLNCQALVSNGAVDGPKTAEEMMAYYETMSADVSLLLNDPASLGQFLRYGAVDDLTDEKNGVCFFDNGRFAAYTRFAQEKNASGRLKLDSVPGSGEQRQLVREGKLILYSAVGITDLLSYVRMEQALGGTLVPVGYPNEARLVCGERYLNSLIGITQACEHPEEALAYLWEFFRPSAEVSVQFNRLRSANSMTRTDIYAQADALAGFTVVNADDDSRWLVVSDAEAADYPGAQLRITRETAERYIAYLDSIEKNADPTGPVWDIVNDEINSDVPSTPEELADKIQSRVSILLAERAG